MADLWYARHSPDQCCEEVSRGGELTACDSQAVAVILDVDGAPPYPVCVYHSRAGRMVALRDLFAPS